MSLDQDEYDVFRDGQVILKAAPGHTPGHQVLVLKLPSTGRVMLSGDLYHYPQERTLHRPPPENEFNVQQSAASRVTIEGVSSEDQDGPVDRTRLRRQREAQEVARLLRVSGGG